MSADARAIRSMIKRWHAATNRGDVDTVVQFMSADAEFFVAGRPPMKGRDAFRAGLEQVLSTHRIESAGDVREVRVSGDLAYCVTFLTVAIYAHESDDANARQGYSLSVFARQPDGTWLLVRDANLLGGSPT